ncbi:MAG: glycosyltransferase family 2 protein [Deltaproteobacteria bacterium]|nr:glycosyltransferase family 2 protein [Deltaproteobacteria bacterium]
MNTQISPLITIGMPVYNGMATIDKAIRSLLAQTCADFTLIVSDNASTDGTREYLQRLQKEGDPRIVCVFQPENLGAVRNFKALLDLANTPYFMWAASDDYWEPTFVEKNLTFLQQNPDYVASISKVQRSDLQTSDSVEMGTLPLRDTVRNNIIRYILKPGWNSRFYGIHRTTVIQQAWIKTDFWAQDWAVMANTLLHGKHNEIQEVLMHRSAGGASSVAYKTIVQLNKGAFHTKYPLFRFTLYLFNIRPLWFSLRVWTHFLSLNLKWRRYMFRNRKAISALMDRNSKRLS